MVPAQHAQRHLGIDRLVGVLHDADPAGRLDRDGAPGSRVRAAGQDHADHPLAIDDGRRLEQTVHRRPALRELPVRFEHDLPRLRDPHVLVSRRQHDAASEQRRTLDGIAHRHPRIGVEDLQHRGCRLRADVERDEDRGIQLARQPTEELAQRAQAAERSADHDDIACVELDVLFHACDRWVGTACRCGRGTVSNSTWRSAATSSIAPVVFSRYRSAPATMHSCARSAAGDAE